MSDSQITVEQLKERLRAFRDARDWLQFHDPKNLAEAISIEAGELQEHFLWKTKEQVAEKLSTNSEYKQEVVDELADIMCFVLNMTNSLGIDLSDAVVQKLDKADKKYPVEKAKGNATKYTQL